MATTTSALLVAGANQLLLLYVLHHPSYFT